MSVHMSTDEFIKANYGISTTFDINKVRSSVGTSEVQILRFDPQRTSFAFINNSANNIWILPKSGVSSSVGILIAANGGSYVLDWQVDFNLVTQEWFAVAAGASSNVTIIENYIV